MKTVLILLLICASLNVAVSLRMRDNDMDALTDAMHDVMMCNGRSGGSRRGRTTTMSTNEAEM